MEHSGMRRGIFCGKSRNQHPASAWGALRPLLKTVLGLKPVLSVSRKGADLVANGLFQTFVASVLNPFCLSSLIFVLDLAVVGTAWVNEETETSLDVEWENPLTEVDYYKLRYGPLTGQEVAEVTVPRSRDPKSRYDITGKNLHREILDAGCRSYGEGRQFTLGLRDLDSRYLGTSLLPKHDVSVPAFQDWNPRTLL